MKGVERRPCLEKSVLKNIVAILMREHYTTYLPVKLFAILSNQCLKPLTACLGSLQHLFQLGVVYLHSKGIDVLGKERFKRLSHLAVIAVAVGIGLQSAGFRIGINGEIVD